MGSGKIDKPILKKLKAGDYLAFKAVYDSYAQPLLSFIYKIIKDIDLAEDILQLTFVKIWKNHQSIDIDKSFDAYIFQIASHSSIDALRHIAKDERKKERLREQGEELALSVEEAFLLKEQNLLIENVLAQLPAQRREVFRLCKLEGYSYQEAADALGISPSTISNQLVSALKTLRQLLKEHGGKPLVIIYLSTHYIFY